MDRKFMIFTLRLLMVILWRMIYTAHNDFTDNIHKDLIRDADLYMINELHGRS